jgi:hypothetical protein
MAPRLRESVCLVNILTCIALLLWSSSQVRGLEVRDLETSTSSLAVAVTRGVEGQAQRNDGTTTPRQENARPRQENATPRQENARLRQPSGRTMILLEPLLENIWDTAARCKDMWSRCIDTKTKSELRVMLARCMHIWTQCRDAGRRDDVGHAIVMQAHGDGDLRPKRVKQRHEDKKLPLVLGSASGLIALASGSVIVALLLLLLRKRQAGKRSQEDERTHIITQDANENAC